MEDNRVDIGLVQTKDADEVKQLKSGEKIEVILKHCVQGRNHHSFSKQVDNNYAHATVAALRSKVKQKDCKKHWLHATLVTNIKTNINITQETFKKRIKK